MSNNFKSAYVNQVSQQNSGINTAVAGIKDVATLALGIAGFSGALGSGALAKAGKHALAGRVGGVGGNIMLSTMTEKTETIKEVEQNKKMLTIDDARNFTINTLQGNNINNSAIKQLRTVFDTLQNVNGDNNDTE